MRDLSENESGGVIFRYNMEENTFSKALR